MTRKGVAVNGAPAEQGLRPGPEASATRKRASRRQVRLWAWTAGALSFLSPWAFFGLSPKPAQSASPTSTHVPARTRPVIVVITKKIIYTRSPTASVSSSGPVQYVYAPTAPPVAVSCGTHPC